LDEAMASTLDCSTVNWTIPMWGRRANGYGSVIDGTDSQQAVMGTTLERADYEAGQVMERVCNVFFVRDWDMFGSLVLGLAL
jgi:hypothetical protein